MIKQLIRKGVKIPNPESVQIGEDVDIARIDGKGVTIFAGNKIFGSRTLICQGAQIGYEGPATIDNCYVGPRVRLKSGFFSRAAFLENSSCGSGSHVREGTILEEGAGIAHTVGLKQTILFPYVTLGSLINFCDCLMAGGTSAKDHSEVGSSYIHFNYTPNQDKATPSLIGDVPRGVMLNQSPIFLGGQGGLVGPCRIAYGTVIAAGSICRKDQLEGNRLVIEANARSGSVLYKTGTYGNVKRLLFNNFHFIGNLLALRQWYLKVRGLFVSDSFPQILLEGLVATLQLGIDERIAQLGRLQEKMDAARRRKDAKSGSASLQDNFCQHWPEIRDLLVDLANAEGERALCDNFLNEIERQIQSAGRSYRKVIHGLDPKQAALGTAWLDSIVQYADTEIGKLIPNVTSIQRGA